MRKVLKALLVLCIIGAGAGVWYLLVATKKVPKRAKRSERPTLVEVVEALSASEPVIIDAMGTVMASRSVTVQPEVSGRIIYQSPNLVPGGRFRKGEILVRIDPRDYDLALKQQRAKVVQSDMELAREKGLKTVAEREWNLIKDEVQPTEDGRKLALREIQLETAQAALDAAKSLLEQAELMRSRTVITSPFPALVSEEFVDVGQVVSPGTRVATLVASDRFWVRVSLPMDRLSLIHIPGINAPEGSPVKVFQKAGQNMHVEREGRVVKLEGSLDPRGKMARLIVEIEDPLGTPGEDGMLMPLLLDAYVQVSIQGPEIEGLIALPRLALRQDNHVWVKAADGKLSIRKVEVVWTKTDQVFVRGGIQPGDKVVKSRISTPVDGMLLRTPDDPQTEAPPGRKPVASGGHP